MNTANPASEPAKLLPVRTNVTIGQDHASAGRGARGRAQGGEPNPRGSSRTRWPGRTPCRRQNPARTAIA